MNIYKVAYRNLKKVLQRKEQYTKQTLEMKKAYKQKYPELSGFTDFIKRYSHM